MKHSDWFRRGLKGIQRSLQKTLLTRLLPACAPIKGYNLIAKVYKGFPCITHPIIPSWTPLWEGLCLLYFVLK
jgi:hypothetical protein